MLENPVFRNINYLDPSHIPTEYKHRTNEMNTLATHITPALYNSLPIHTILYGNSATGKTTAIKKLFTELKENTENIIPIYVNCRTKNTAYRIYIQMYETILQKTAPRRGSSSTRLYNAIIKELTNTDTTIIICFDDINYLLGAENKINPDAQQIIQDLLRCPELYNINVGIYMIITGTEFKYTFEQDINTLFQPATVYFREYNTQQLFNIIQERCTAVFYSSVPNVVVMYLVQLVQKNNNNLRVAWNLLKNMGVYMLENEEYKISLDLIKRIVYKNNTLLKI